jgi:hypothetical protein
VGAALAGAAVLTVSIGLATVAFASAGSGPVTGSVIATGSMPTGMGLAVHPGTNTIVGQYTFGPHSSTGWHSHPGKTLVVVQSGTFTVYHDDCHASIDWTCADQLDVAADHRPVACEDVEGWSHPHGLMRPSPSPSRGRSSFRPQPMRR